MSDLRAFEPWRRDFGRDLGELRGLEQGALQGFGFLFCWSFLLRYYFVSWAVILLDSSSLEHLERIACGFVSWKLDMRLLPQIWNGGGLESIKVPVLEWLMKPFCPKPKP